MIIAGLTGSIGMGKTTTAAMFAEEGAPVFDADAAVHALYEPGGAAVEPIARAFPGVVKEGRVDRALLGAQVRGDPDAFKRLEAIVHPLVAEERRVFLAQADAAGADVVILDIPLLFESGGDAAVDAIIVVTAPAEVQRARVLERPGMTPQAFEAILAKQTPDSEKRAQADWVIDTANGFDSARAQVREVLNALRDRARGERDKHA